MMSEECITSKHIEKLSHHIPEIRERALLNIASKLDRGIYYDNDLARSKELFWQLCNWFRENDGQRRHEEVVIKILYKIIKSEIGSFLIELHGPQSLISEFTELRQSLNKACHEKLDELIKHLEDFNTDREHIHVPPLNLDSVCTSVSSTDDDTCNMGTTATIMAGLIENLASVELADAASYSCTEQIDGAFKYYTFQWQWLIGADRHVLESVEDTLRNPTEPSALLNSCEFFTDVLLSDFPAEVFLQRPAIVKQFHDILWSSPSSRVTTAILKCLSKLTKEFIKRIRYYDNPSTHNLKLSNYHVENSIRFVPEETSNDVDDEEDVENGIECITETKNLMKSEMNVPQYCLNTLNSIFDYLYVTPEAGDSFRRKKCMIGINTALTLLKDTVDLLKLALKSNLWESKEKHSPRIKTLLEKFTETFKKYGEVLQHFRIKVQSEDFNDETRLIQLHLLANLINLHSDFVPSTRAMHIFPANLKNVLSEMLLDAPMSRLLPSLHQHLIELTKTFQLHTTYDTVIRICRSMSAALKLLREWKSLPFTKNLQLMSEALVGLEFHGNTKIIAIFIDLCANKLTMHSFDDDVLQELDDILLKLLAYKNEEIRAAAYKMCQQKVIKTIGVKLNVSKQSAPGCQILFLLRAAVIYQLAAHGMRDHNEVIQSHAEDMLVHILKSKILVCDEIWEATVTALIPTMPVFMTFTNDQTSLIGRTVLALLDPDRGRLMNFANVDVLRFNVGLLFATNDSVRMEAMSRICWLLSNCNNSVSAGTAGNQTKRVLLLPHLNNLHDKVLSLICQVERRVDFKTYRNTQTHFYQPSSLHQVIDLLSTADIEPVIKRSAVTQISVMMEDPLLHSTFLDSNGLQVLKEVMLSALTENNYQNYPDSIVPCLSILKNLCIYNPSVRMELANSDEYFNYILRGVFMFCTESRIKLDGAILLFFIVFNGFIKGSPLKNDLTILYTLTENLSPPFDSKVHGKTSEYQMESLKHLQDDKWALRTLQIHWNIEWFQGLDKLLQTRLIYDSNTDFASCLKLNSSDVRAIRSTSLEYLVQNYLQKLNDSHSHMELLQTLQKLTSCLKLYTLFRNETRIDFESFSWEKSFKRFLNAPPAGAQDTILLSHVFDVLSLLLPLFKSTVANDTQSMNWITSLLTNKTHYCSDILSVELTDDQEPEVEILLNSLLQLVNVCAISEQTLFSDVVAEKTTRACSYSHVIKILAKNLQCKNAKHFYNLAYLDRLLTSLTHLTATHGWSEYRKAGGEEAAKLLLGRLCNASVELLHAFNAGKGPTAPNSLMGINITRNVVLMLNHVVAEMQHYEVPGWEEFFRKEDIHSAYQNVFALRKSRDLTLRAAAIHLMSGFAMSYTASVEMIRDVAIEQDYLSLWKTALGILCDHEESAIVRENATMLLANLCSHTTSSGEDENYLCSGLLMKKSPKSQVVQTDNQKKILIALLDTCNFFIELETILKRLYTASKFNFTAYRKKKFNSDIETDNFSFIYNKIVEASNASDSLNSNVSKPKFEHTYAITTTGFITALANFVYNLACLLPEYMCLRILEFGLIKLFFKCVTLPTIEFDNPSDLMFYADIIQMNTSVCTLLSQMARISNNCLLTIGNTRDCLNMVTALLDPALYIVSFMELLYLRNKLWSSAFDLIDILLMGGTCSTEEDGTNRYDMNALLIQLETRKVPFILSLCQSISTDLSNDLQLSALNSLTSLLRCNNATIVEEFCDSDTTENSNASSDDSTLPLVSPMPSARPSIQCILDTTKTPRTAESTSRRRTFGSKSGSTTKLQVLEDIFFKPLTLGPHISSKTSLNSMDNEEKMAGAELCKLLLELYDIVQMQQAASKTNTRTKKKGIVLNTLTGLLLVSNEAKQYALANGLLPKIIEHLRQTYIQLSLESVDAMRKLTERKRITPVLTELESLLGLITNFIYANADVKIAASHFGLTDIIHKLWIWLLANRPLLVVALKLLCTLTTNCPAAAASLPLTTSIVGASLRKTPSNSSLLHLICTLISKEMDLVSRTHCLDTLRLCFDVLHNAVEVTECRFVLAKNNFLAHFAKLHPALTKRQRPWEQVEMIWLEFLGAFSEHPEGQTLIGKMQEVFDILLSLCNSPIACNRAEALETLKNIAFHSGNRARLLGSDEFLNVLLARYTAALPVEVNIVTTMVWALAANCQRAKMLFKSAHIDQKIADYLRVLYLNKYTGVTEEDVETLQYVLGLLTQSN